ncbi:uncharacterized protein THITE_2121942 [Thermothielavioides terrestris NRRL 8126]|uniref:Uncharacterized protein n=1 Tax=Thermothielavioides terrestris (strain ATCC 38088 / NRRL 8126) TaxID=578455 RepID=G2RFH9_THETT|nr:uncharacterized protein THITE_2121942 [Thermothielavioides terrestris NRRL 8126]AEO70462.1 hypothetical protein THITE_2121942 [Thermothielavioides terrestris NRRL 8126]
MVLFREHLVHLCLLFYFQFILILAGRGSCGYFLGCVLLVLWVFLYAGGETA